MTGTDLERPSEKDRADAVGDPYAGLVACCQQGDTAAFARLVNETQSDVYNVAYSVLHNHQEAQDITQEVYVRAWRALPSFRGEARVRSWLYRIALNACLNRKRRLRKELHIVDREDPFHGLASTDVPDPASEAVRRDRNEFIWATVDRLSEKYRLVITLFYRNELSYGEIASLLDVPLGTVKAHLHRARKALAKLLRRRNANETL